MACRFRYPPDLSDAGWELVEPLIPQGRPGGRADPASAVGDCQRAGVLAAGVCVAAAAARPAALADGLPLLASLAAGGPVAADPRRAVGEGTRAPGT
jgi:hypothetical protein